MTHTAGCCYQLGSTKGNRLLLLHVIQQSQTPRKLMHLRRLTIHWYKFGFISFTYVTLAENGVSEIDFAVVAVFVVLVVGVVAAASAFAVVISIVYDKAKLISRNCTHMHTNRNNTIITKKEEENHHQLNDDGDENNEDDHLNQPTMWATFQWPK